MVKKITYVNLPLYSIATFKNYIYMSGGGGGKTGIPNQILIFDRKVSQTPANRISTGSQLYENITVSLKHQLMACCANNNLLIFDVKEGGKQLLKLFEIEVDQSLKNPTINSICFHYSEKIVAVGGDDTFVRFFKVSKQYPPQLLWQHNQHRELIRKIDSKQSDLFVSNDQQVAVIANQSKKEILRKFYRDQLNPLGSVLQSAYFLSEKDSKNLKLILCHYIVRQKSYVTTQLKENQYRTLQISKDQSCATAKQGPFLGVACGQGATYIVDTQTMEIVSKQKGHQFVITAGVLTKGQRFITGTSSCSYLVQQISGGSLVWLYSFVLTFALIFLFVYGIGSFGQQL